MNSRNHSVPISLVESLLQAARYRNTDLKLVFDRAELSSLHSHFEPDSNSADFRIQLEDLGPLLRSLWKEMGDEASGFLSSPLKLGVFSMMCHAIITAGNLRRGLLRSARFIALLTDDIVIRLEETGDEASLEIDYKNTNNLDETFFVTSLFVIWIRLSCWMIDQPILLERIQFRFDKPSYDDEYSLMFPCRHSFAQSSNKVVFNRRLLALPLKQDPESLSKFLNHAPESLLTQFRSDESITGQIKRMLLHRQGMQTELENQNFDAIAEVMHMTTHTLRRRLKSEGNSFQDIKDSIRRDRALVLLDQPDLSLQEISEELGFSEPAAFNRAFKKWTGLTPGAYRF